MEKKYNLQECDEDIEKIRKIASKYTPEQIEQIIADLEKEENNSDA